MAHQQQMEKAGYRQWAKAGLGLRYLKDGLAPFCQDITNQQHKDILKNIKHTKSLTQPVTCGTCQLRTLKPDHVKIGNKVCPYGQSHCNCWFPNGKYPCPSNICGAIYDSIIQSHASTPPAPSWKNTDAHLWTADPWSIAKCFINAPGYDQKTSAADTDCAGLLHMIINNRYYHNYIACNVTGSSTFSKIRQYRNVIFHTSSMELDEKTANLYIDNMISVLQDGKKLVHQPEAQQAVKNLQELKNKYFIITSESFEELLTQVREEMVNVMKSTESTKEECEELKIRLFNIEELLKQTRDEMTKSAESSKELLQQTRDEMTKSAESTKEELVGLNRRVCNIETHVSEQKEYIKRILVEDSPEQKQLEYEKAKAEWQRKLIKEYNTTVLKVPAIPLLPDSTCEFSKTYVQPIIVSEVKDENRNTKETNIKSVSEIFTRNGVPLKSVYVVGDAGTGKSSFCKYLVNCWCMAHSEGHFEEDEFDGANQMKKFDFLFYISLRHNQNIVSIHEMLKNQYDINILCTLLEKDSAKMIILLDGLDEWSFQGKSYNQFQTMGLPKHDVYKDYTIVTTSRPWKIHTLRIRDTEIQQLLKLKGFDDKREREMIKRTVSTINSRKGECRNIDECRRKLGENSLKSLKQIPFMLQQLICLWFDGKLDKTSRCVVFTEMLELFFTWNDDKTEGTSSVNKEGSQDAELPQYLADKEICESNGHLIYDMSLLAYETLFNSPKAKSLTFDISVFRKLLNISDEKRESCFKLGILTNDRCPSLSVSERPKSMFSFIHKSVQEFLAAINIAISFKTKISSSKNVKNVDVQRECIQFVKEVFKNCSTIIGLLEHSNVIIMLCGLEPKLATHLSRYIYDIVKVDPLNQRYRRTLDYDFFCDFICFRDVNKLILDMMEECNVCSVENSPTFYIRNLYIDSWGKSCDIVVSNIDQQQISFDHVHSINIGDINSTNVEFSKYLPKFKHLEKIEIRYDTCKENVEPRIDEVNNFVGETIKINASTLTSLCLNDNGSNDKLYSLCKQVLFVLPSMNNLVAIEMAGIMMSHDDTTNFFEFFEGTCHLEQIFIDIKCECERQHEVNLSKHQQLNYLFLSSSICLTDVDSVDLEVFRCLNMKSTSYMKIIDSFRKCDKLNELALYVDENNKSQSFHFTRITDRLVSVLPLFRNLRSLSLRGFKLTDNIIQAPSEMKGLKLIKLSCVVMSLTTWLKFVDNLTSFPHSVDVKLYNFCITGDGEEFNDDMLPFKLGRGGKGSDARQYVRDQEQLFNVKRDRQYYFDFSTEK